MASVPAVRPRLSGKADPVIGSALGWPEFELVQRFRLSGANCRLRNGSRFHHCVVADLRWESDYHGQNGCLTGRFLAVCTV